MALTTYTAGEVLTAASLNDNFNYAVTVPAAPDTAIFNETQSAATAGGTSTATTWTKRTLNTTVVNNITGCSIASSVITLLAGTYLIEAYAPFYASQGLKIKLRNTTDSTDDILGQNAYINSGVYAGQAFLTGIVTIAASKNFELQYWVEVGQASQGLGITNNSSTSSVYSIIKIVKVA
jgi:hypothetical protein